MFENIRIAEKQPLFEKKYLSDLVMDMVDKNGRNHDDLGRFSKESSDPKEWGESYPEYGGKPDEAINKLLKEKGGYVPKAIYKHGIGDIDFVWGVPGEKGTERGYGLSHIIRRRSENNHDGVQFVKKIPSLIKYGTVFKEPDKTRAFIETKDKKATISLKWYEKNRTWLLTAYFKDEYKKG